MVEPTLALLTGLIAGGAAFLAGWLLNRASRRLPSAALAEPPEPPVTLMLRDGAVVDSSSQADRLFGRATGEPLGWAEIVTTLQPLFGPLPDAPPRSPGSYTALHDPQTRLTLTPDGDSLRLEIRTPPLPIGEALRLRCNEPESKRLHRAVARAPLAIWMTNSAHVVTWSNTFFDDLRAQAGAAPGSAPFSLHPDPAQPLRVTRTRLGGDGCAPASWYEVQSCRVSDGWLHYAQNIDPVIAAETTQRTFLQTLTRIFAHLPIALAVFDKERRLVLFNPALLDLTQLPADFLTGRPNLLSFFDMLRDRQVLPEPRDYRSWRDKLGEVIAAASSDHYVETWSLPSGATYRMTGRPHPDGGIAFLFEDISAEVSLTRHFRQELETSQSVLDSLEEAIAVFSRTGKLAFCNAPYREMWGSDPEESPADLGIKEATRHWQAAFRPSPIWGDLREFVTLERDRAPWDAELHDHDGQPLRCLAEPLPGGATMVRFCQLPVRQTETLAQG